MRIRDVLSAAVMSLVLVGCDGQADYSQHFKHGDDPFYRGTYVVRETYTSLFNQEANEQRTLREFKILATDVDENREQLAYSDLLSLQKQGYRIIIK